MIRDARASDINYFIEAAQKYLKITGDDRFLTFDEESFTTTVLGMMGSDAFSCIVSTIDDKPVGHITMCMVPSLFDASQITAKILIVWGKGSLSLVKECEKRARNAGAVVIFADSHPKLRQKTMARAYKKKGFSLSDQLYIKEL